MTTHSGVSLLERYQRLIEVTHDLGSTLDLKALLNRLIHAATDLLEAEAASILLYDSKKNELYFQAATNIDEPLMRGLIVPVDTSIAGWIVINGEPINIEDVRQDDRHFAPIGDAVQFQTKSLLGVPLIAQDKTVGVLEALNKISGKFTDDDQALLTALAAQAAVAIENSRLFQQSDLIADFVHEIRTPLSSLNTAAHLLLQPQVPEDKREKIIDIIRKETTRLSDMATSFLDLARMESGRSQFDVQEYNPAELISECANLIRSKAHESGISLHLDLDKNMPSLIGDRDKIKQALLNLLSNAIKYNSLHGKINLRSITNENEIIISVQDSGNGIAPEYIPHLFEKFYRVPGSQSLAQGTGLGLSLVKRIVEEHGGHVGIDSEVGVGTIFHMHLPYR